MNRSVAIGLLFWLAAAGAAPGAEIIVPDSVSTLQEAIEGVREGDRIVLLPGEYTVRAASPGGVGFAIVGRDGAGTTILRGAAETEPILAFAGENRPVEIRGLTFDRKDAPMAYTILASGLDLRIEECVFLEGAGINADSCTGTIRANRFEKCFDGIRLIRSPLLVEGNEFEGCVQYALVARASRAEIVRNRFLRTGGSCIVIVGKRDFPVVGGAPGKGNVFILNQHLLIANESRNDIDARYNYWGPVVTSTIERLGYPANIPEFQDGWDSEDRAAGEIDYRNWLGAEEEIRGGRPIWRFALFGGLFILVLIVVARRRSASK